MSDQNDFVFPGILDPVPDGTPAAFHEAGLERLSVMYDPSDVFPGDPYLEAETPDMRARETLPQWGPNYVAAIHQALSQMDQKLDAVRRHAMERWSQEPVTANFVASMVTAIGGQINQTLVPNCMLYEVPPGFTFALHRLFIYPSSNPNGILPSFGQPFTNANAYWELREDNEAIDGGSMVSGAGSIPVLRTWGTRDAHHCRDGAVLSLFMTGGPAQGVTITVKGQGTLVRETEG